MVPQGVMFDILSGLEAIGKAVQEFQTVLANTATVERFGQAVFDREQKRTLIAKIRELSSQVGQLARPLTQDLNAEISVSGASGNVGPSVATNCRVMSEASSSAIVG